MTGVGGRGVAPTERARCSGVRPLEGGICPLDTAVDTWTCDGCASEWRNSVVPDDAMNCQSVTVRIACRRTAPHHGRASGAQGGRHRARDAGCAGGRDGEALREWCDARCDRPTGDRAARERHDRAPSGGAQIFHGTTGVVSLPASGEWWSSWRPHGRAPRGVRPVGIGHAPYSADRAGVQLSSSSVPRATGSLPMHLHHRLY